MKREDASATPTTSSTHDVSPRSHRGDGSILPTVAGIFAGIEGIYVGTTSMALTLAAAGIAAIVVALFLIIRR